MANDKNSLISDVAGLSDPITKLIETVGAGINTLTTPWQTKRNALADAQAIETITQSLNNVPGEVTYSTPNFSITVKKDTVEENAITRLIQTEIEHQLNINDIVSKTAEILKTKESVSPTPVSPDWYRRYINIAQDISDNETQILWAQILAGEIETPDSFSFRTLDFLRNITQTEASIIQSVLKYAFESNGQVYILGEKEYLETVNIPFLHSLLLEELNLASSGLQIIHHKNSVTYYRLARTPNFLRITNTSGSEARFPVMKLSSLGKEIYNLTPPFYSRDNLIEHIKFLKNNTMTYELIEDVIFLGEQIQWKNDKITLLKFDDLESN
jgi:hypothetical protein